MAARRQPTRRRRSYTAKKRRATRSGIPPLAIVFGAIMGVKSAEYWRKRYLSGYTPEDAASMAYTGVALGAAGNDWKSITNRMKRGFPAWMGLGILGHELLGNRRGAFGTGIGAKLNGKMGKIKL